MASALQSSFGLRIPAQFYNVFLCSAFSLKQLKLIQKNISLSVSGIGTMSSSTVHLVLCTISSSCQNYHFTIEFNLLPTITEKLPSQMFDINLLNIPDNVINSLTDSQLVITGPVDILFIYIQFIYV